MIAAAQAANIHKFILVGGLVCRCLLGAFLGVPLMCSRHVCSNGLAVAVSLACARLVPAPHLCFQLSHLAARFGTATA